MAALEKLSHFVGIDSKKFTKQENCILEAELYIRVHQEIWHAYKARNKNSFYLILTIFGKEDTIMELYVIRSLINDLLKSEAYTLSGIAYYTQAPEEMIEDLYIGHKLSPAIVFIRKLIELHKLIKPDMYQNIRKKLTMPEEKNDGIQM